MKFSNYNLLVPDRKFLYNARTRQMAFLNDRDLELFQVSDEKEIANLSKPAIESLLSAGFIVPNAYSELDELKYKYWAQKFSKDTLNLSIMTTQDCNFECVYCFEDHIKSYMAEEVQTRIKKCIEKYMAEYKNLHIDWYGGEPLLNLDCIKNIGQYAINYCRNNKKGYTSSITTNGYLLSDQVYELLKNVGVTYFQITIDGSKEDHDKRRCLIDGLPTYNKIIENIQNGLKKNFRIGVRINVDNDNVEGCCELIDDLAKLENIEDNLSLVICTVTPCENYTNIMFERDIVSDIVKIYSCALDHEITIGRFLSLSTPLDRFCVVDTSSQYIISPKGQLFKCGEKFDENDPGFVGQLRDDGSMEIKKWREIFWEKDPFEYKECIQCGVLPLCMGGCLLKRKVKGIPPCIPEFKYCNQEMLSLYSQYILKEMERQKK